MPDYQQGKIYKIISPHTDKIYIGSTTRPYLANRKALHKSQYNTWKTDNTKSYCSSFILYDLGEVEFILIESYKCNSKDELTARERYWIEQNINIIVNSNKAHTTKEERKEYMNEYLKEYAIKNEEKLKEYRIKNKDKIKEYQKEYKKEYDIKNEEKIKEYRKEYYIKNKNKIKEYHKQRNEIKMLI